ncbi:Crp/Fnr family transcriptional regulator [Dyadobacter sp. CY312]|uniref:Crp/Fnr family transcriptional regulator n=1 Tax=Dyadobacter sp. CY312 TaxID=2907303 RepID=UPI001F3C3CB4|nr:Crp/Fnr family transcriptional regulator [Dyadobacter sp. CY312]MCE7041327.1 Crp/Fnr family transcriptional regulator [Dyadobacter sp. CY312]
MRAHLRQHIEQIVALTDEEFDFVDSHFVLRDFKKHQFAVQEGNEVDMEFFVLEGLLKSTFLSQDGKEHILQFSMENWWVTDYQAFHFRQKATLNIECIEKVSVLGISYENKEKLCREMHKMEHFFRIKNNSGYIGLQQRILSFLTSDAKTRYNQLLVKYPGLYQRIPKTLLASYLGVSRETLSRL